jgi:protein phosphatase
MSIYNISVFVKSNVGKRRQNNEDNYYLDGNYVDSASDVCAKSFDKSELIVCVCDGMGGEEAGEVASQIAVESVGKCYNNLLESNLSDEAVIQFAEYANSLICDEISKCKKRMGTTYTLLGFKDDVVTVSNIGDSRVYVYSDGELKQLSKDHTEAQTMVDAGIVSEEESMKTPEKHKLTQHLGIFPDEMVIEPYTVKRLAKNNDRYLLCSDGLTDMLSFEDISAILQKNMSVEETVDELISFALENGGKDNVTVALCEIKNNGFVPEESLEKTVVLPENENTDETSPTGNKRPPDGKFRLFKNKVVLIVIAVFLILCISLIVAVAIKAKRNKDSKDTQMTNETTEITDPMETSSSKGDDYELIESDDDDAEDYYIVED